MLQYLDPLTKVGFDAIVEDHGLHQALQSHRAALLREYEQRKDFRWHGQRWQRAVDNIDFEIKWLAAHGSCTVFRTTYQA